MRFLKTIVCGIGMFGCIAGHADVEQFQYLPERETVELYPQMRLEPLSAALYQLQTDKIASYLRNVLILDDMDQYQTLPYIVGFDRDANIGGAGDTAYTKGLNIKNDLSEYSLLEPGETLTDPETGENLGLQVFVIGNAVVQKFGKTQTILISNTITDAEINTRLIPLVGIDLPGVYDVKYPPTKLKARVLAIPDNRNLGGQYNTVIVNLGKKQGLKAGHVLDIVEGIREVEDPNCGNTIDLPSSKVGEVLIFNVKDKISLGIITYSTRTIVINDLLTVPTTD